MSARDAAGGLSAADASPAPPHLLLPRCAAQLTNIRAASLDLHRPRFGRSLLRDDLCRPPSTPAHLPHTDSPQATIKTPPSDVDPPPHYNWFRRHSPPYDSRHLDLRSPSTQVGLAAPGRPSCTQSVRRQDALTQDPLRRQPTAQCQACPAAPDLCNNRTGPAASGSKPSLTQNFGSNPPPGLATPGPLLQAQSSPKASKASDPAHQTRSDMILHYDPL
jgi:hypothetical protein